MPRPRRLLLIVNPHATAVRAGVRDTVLTSLRSAYDVDVADTQARDHATALARAADGYDAIVTLGGDGTVNEAANGLAGATTPLTPLPGGSANVFARMLGIPGDLPAAAAHLVGLAGAGWRERRVDLPEVNGRRFLFSSGVGLDASVVRRVDAHPHWKRRLGPYYFAYAGITDFLARYVVDPPRMEVAVGGRVLRGVTALVQNGDPYTYFGDVPLHVAEGTALDDGTLGGVVLRTSRPTVMPTIMWRIFSARARVAGHRQVDGFAGARDLVVRSTDGRPLPLQVDGDFVGEVDEAVYATAPGALRVVA